MPHKEDNVQVEDVSQDDESDEYDVEYDDEHSDDGDHSDEESGEEQEQRGQSLTALLLGGQEEEGSGDEGWTPDGGPEPAEDSGNESEKEEAPETAPTPAHLKGKGPAATKRDREEVGEQDGEDAAQVKRTKT